MMADHLLDALVVVIWGLAVCLALYVLAGALGFG